MKSLIIYESTFGNTERIAFALRDALQFSGTSEVVTPDKIFVPDLKNFDLIIVGSPTQQFRPLPGTITFLKSIPPMGLVGKKVAAFDTRIDLQKVNNKFLNLMVRIFGYAAEPIAKNLKAKGGELIAPAAGFFVDDTKGPLTSGESERAQAWARHLITLC